MDNNKLSMVTPIYSYVKNAYSNKKTLNEFLNEDTFRTYFGANLFALESPEEI